jgi:hypothetical protein
LTGEILDVILARQPMLSELPAANNGSANITSLRTAATSVAFAAQD